MTAVVWFRDDLRTLDHPALHAAAQDPAGLVCVFLLDEESPGVRPLGGAARWWLHHSLRSLAAALAELGAELVLRRGPAEREIPAVAREVGATRVLWNRRYSPAERGADQRVQQLLDAAGVTVSPFLGNLLREPWTVRTAQGGAYRVFTPFWRACVAELGPVETLPAPGLLTPAPRQPAGLELRELALLPTAPDWSGGLARAWTPGEPAALDRLDEFLAGDANRYATARDHPAVPATSRLSPHLRWGELSPRTVWARAVASGADVGTFLSEVGWREFAWVTTYHAGDLAAANLDRRYDAFPWPETEPEQLRAWQRGRTGFPLVDAGMRELWETGAMHNRVRMVTASFLVKNLLIDWRLGEAWFWDTLVDADVASNPFNWQWIAGSGADAAPYFRIFNPLTQQARFDADGRYCERWAPDSLLTPPLVDLRESRLRALAALDEMKAAPTGE